jgi:antitoxin CptB
MGRNEMSQQVEKARMLWRCRRGMLELDLLLERFMAEGYDNLTDKQLATFKSLLEEPDPDLYAWFMGYDTPKQHEFKQFIDWFRQHFCQANR